MNRDFQEDVPMAETKRRLAVRPKGPERSAFRSAGVRQFLTSNRRTADHGPDVPPLFARTRHHILSVGSVLVLN